MTFVQALKLVASYAGIVWGFFWVIGVLMCSDAISKQAEKDPGIVELAIVLAFSGIVSSIIGTAYVLYWYRRS